MNETDVCKLGAMLVLNGKSAGKASVREAVKAMREAGMPLAVRVTWEAGDAERYAREAVEAGMAAVVAGGGDGTLNQIANALAHRPEPADALPALGLIPLGTANDFATGAGIPVAPEAALRLLLAQPAVPIDLLKVDADGQVYWAANLASGGFGTQVTTETSESLKKLLGGLAYTVTGLSKLGNPQYQRAHLRGPSEEWQGDYLALGIGNGRQAGGGQVLCPDAKLDDGLLDVTVVPPLEQEWATAVGIAMTEGGRAALDKVALRRAVPWVEIEPAAPLTLNLDGEPVKAARFRIECVPGRVRMHLPGDSALLSATPHVEGSL